MQELKEKLESLSAGSESAMRNLEATVQNQRAELERLHKEGASGSEALKRMKDKFDKAEADAAKWKQEHDKVVTASLESAKAAREELKTTKADYEKKIADLQQQLKDQAKAAADAAKGDLASKLQKMTADHEAAVAKLKEEIAKLKAKAEADAKAAKDECAKKAAEARADEKSKAEVEMAKVCEGFNKQISDMMSTLKQESVKLEAERKSVQSVTGKLEEQKAATKQVERKLSAKEAEVRPHSDCAAHVEVLNLAHSGTQCESIWHTVCVSLPEHEVIILV